MEMCSAKPSDDGWVDDLDVETGEMCDGLHGFAFVVMGGMLETRQRKPLEDSKLN